MNILNYFNLKESPFELTPNLRFFCGFDTYQHAISTIMFCVEKGEPLIKVIGEVGTGKTLLCRKLIDEIDDASNISLYIPNPSLSSDTVLRLVADELGVDSQPEMTEYTLYKLITDKILSYYAENKRVVLFIDEAQTMNESALEAVRLLTNLESEERKLLQIVLFGQPELDDKLNQKSLRQFRQRIGFTYQLSALSRPDVDGYISRRLVAAGHETGMLFTKKAKDLLYKASCGIPRIMNILAYKSLLSAYAAGAQSVNKKAVKKAISESDSVINTVGKKPARSTRAMYGVLIVLAGILIWQLLVLFHVLPGDIKL